MPLGRLWAASLRGSYDVSVFWTRRADRPWSKTAGRSARPQAPRGHRELPRAPTIYIQSYFAIGAGLQRNHDLVGGVKRREGGRVCHNLGPNARSQSRWPGQYRDMMPVGTVDDAFQATAEPGAPITYAPWCKRRRSSLTQRAAVDFFSRGRGCMRVVDAQPCSS